jgi:hypothetical protein
MNVPQARAELAGVPETALRNPYQRASAASAGHPDDPRAVEVPARPGRPFERSGVPYRGAGALAAVFLLWSQQARQFFAAWRADRR